ncbi:peptidylprolyl isomerase, putative [Theileria equi strain WA]|uniref:Peptidylprolyl isomerase, putative n=1 Tax=Theileria equi strain WA TaxID=1537102 RepID=L1LC91_THEEQ|nr:peptidylprolyl isomerase, putative [Theileria equi strain WA]EKX73067.1 peptidylprolyl isomerase, putative [Theileria equi strain WA]|eukprot:XP_004832519.1 peptidylprolyl isomerase, putative [Theileria equi strain WA]
MGGNTRAFIDVGVGSNLSGRVVFEFFGDVSEQLIENFRSLCKGDATTSIRGKRSKIGYEGCHFFRVVKGEYIQCGDYVNNDGSGGDSIHGGFIKDYPNSKPHAQAGLLTMVNMENVVVGTGNEFAVPTPRPRRNRRNDVEAMLSDGRNDERSSARKEDTKGAGDEKKRYAYGSQFCVTLGKVFGFDRNYVVIGRVVEGMEFIRAIEHVPVDSKYRPQIETGVLKSGLVQVAPRNVTDVSKQRELVDSLFSSLEKQDEETEEEDVETTRCMYSGRLIKKRAPKDSSANTIGKRMLEDALAGKKILLAPEDDEEEDVKEEVQESQDAASVDSEEEDSEQEENEEEEKDEISARLKLLSGKLGECTRLNNHQVVIEQRVNLDPKKEAFYSKVGLEEKGADEQLIPKDLSVTASVVERRYNMEQSKKKNAEFGWNVFNQDALYRAHKKRLRDTSFNSAAYEYQKATLGDAFYKPTLVQFEASEAAKDAVVRNVEKQYKKRDAFSRRRMYDDEAQDISYINERNRVYNKKLERSFGAYTLEIKQNLERGTAL